MSSPRSFEQRVYQHLSRIPDGKITTYSDLAKAVGNPAAARAVGNAMRRNPDPVAVPCYKVVCENGRVGGYALGIPEKIRRLKKEGAVISNGHVQNLAAMRWG